MHSSLRRVVAVALFFLFSLGVTKLMAQSEGNSGSLSGTVIDPTGAVIPSATVSIRNPVSEYAQTTQTDSAGHYAFTNVPFNPYHMVISAPGFASAVQDVDIRAVVPVVLKTALKVSTSATTVTVTGGEDLIEKDSTFHTDVDRSMFKKVPLESQSSSVSSLVTLTSPGVAADSNGLFHGLGDHASNSFSVDGQAITDQQSKVFSNQIPAASIQSIEVISGAPPAEYGDKTSLIIKVTTRSGQGITKPTGSIHTSYGSFGSSNTGFDVAYGKANWGNFIAGNGLNTGRFLDGPEFKVFHDKGNEENVFDRVDYQLTPGDSIHVNLQYTRSWFQTPNSYDNLNVHDQFGNPVGNADQKSKIETFNIAPTYTRLLSQYSVLNFGVYVRKDAYNYYPSKNPLADLGPPNLQSESIGQERTLTNAGFHSDISYVRGINNIKAGAMYEQTFLRENDSLGVVDPTLNSPCLNAENEPVNGFTDPSQCAAAGLQENVASNPNATTPFLPILVPYDLTRGGGLYSYFGHTDVKELALYIEDQIKTGNWLFNLGMRGDLYNGLTVARQAEPRLGTAYSIKPTNTVLRASYARTLETPFNENLVLSSSGCTNAVLAPLLLCTPGVSGTLQPGFRNEFHAGLEQAFSRYFVLSGDYIWKYTHNAFDFSVLGDTPITFPIDWHNSKITGFALRGDVPVVHGVSAYVVMSSVAARFFPPQTAGAGATVGQNGLPFRIDHDEKFNQTTHLQYQFGQNGPWFGFNWRYDSGLVAGSVPFAVNTTTPVDLTGLTADQQQQAGLACGSQYATLSSPLTTCAPSQYHSSLVSIPAPGTENDDHNPPRIAPRSLFDAVVGEDNLFHGDRYRWSTSFTAVNFTNKYALYNFLSTFSGTHYVTPRAFTGEIGFHF
ncbi:MAG TPA: TonB-dependent receptor [Acidobacteriaceae bacterium]|jgi:hypothetical protein|nr:TonB-dependent receptor [Acidobacteriaceae bacterium]